MRLENVTRLPADSIQNDHLRLDYLTTAGPRIVGLSYRGSANLLAEVPEAYADTPNGPYWFRGGHRLWRSPELMPETYALDNEGLLVERSPNGVVLTQPVPGGITKKIEIQLEPTRAACRLTHHLTNCGDQTVRLAPWALTMLRLGGVGIFPQPTVPADPGELLPNRKLVLWPYTRMNDERVIWGDQAVLVKAVPQLPPVKFGYLNLDGWMGYAIDGLLFVKRFRVLKDGEYPDYGCNCETYANHRFIELETLGPLTDLQPGGSVTLVEEWEVMEGLEQPFLSPEIQQAVMAQKP